MSDTRDAGEWIAVFIGEGTSKYHVTADAWDELTAAYGQWIERRIDRVLELTALDGEPVVFAASKISDFSLTTPSGRERDRAWKAAMKKEDGVLDL